MGNPSCTSESMPVNKVSVGELGPVTQIVRGHGNVKVPISRFYLTNRKAKFL